MSDYINESILMWQEFDRAEMAKLKEALAHATDPIRTIIAQDIRWEEGTKLWLLTTATKQQYTHLYFWLCGYGDRMNLETRKKPYCPPPL